MVRFKRLIGYNFITYAFLDLPLDNQGVTSIEGLNLDTGGSNGAGKSLSWALMEHILFGTTSCGISGDAIIGNHAKGYYGIITWISQKKKYKVIQWRGTCKYSEKYNKALGIKIFEDGKSIEEGKNTVDIQKQVANVLGLTHEEFLGSVLLSGEDHVLLKGKPSDRISFLSGPFKLYIYDLILKEVKSDLKILDDKFRELEVVQAKKERAQEELNKLGSLRTKNADLEIYQERLKKLKKKVKRLKNMRDEALETLTTLKAINVKEVNSIDIKKTKSALSILQEEIETTESKILKTSMYLEKVETYETIQEQLKSIKKVDIDSIASEISELTQELTTVEVNYENTIVKINSFKRVKGKAKCPTCHRKFSSSDQQRIQNIVKEANKEVNLLKERAEDIRERLSKLERKQKQGEEYKQLKSQLPDIDKKESSKDIDHRIDRLEKKLESAKESKEKLRDKLRRVKEAMVKIKELNIDIQKVNKTTIKIETQKELFDSQLSVIESKVSNNIAKIERIEEALKEREVIEEEMAGYNEELSILKKLKRKESLLRVLEEAYGSRGLKLDKIRVIIERFQRLLPKYTSILFSEKSIKFEVKGNDKKLGFIAKRPLSKPFDIKALSKGEKRRMNLALTFMIKYALPASKSTNLVILDEIDSGLDALGRNILLDEFLPELKSKIGTIIVISHNKQIAQAPIFNQHWIAEKQHEKSQMIIN